MACSRHFLHDPNCPACRQEKHEQFLKNLHDQNMEQADRLEEETRRAADKMEEAAERHEEALRDHAQSVRDAAEETAAKHRKTTAETFRLQSRNLSAGAQELYGGGLWDSAFKEAGKSIELDRRNIRAYRIAALAMQKLGNWSKATEYHHQQIGLLGISEYRHNLQVFLDVLQSLPANAALLGSFFEKLTKNASSWTPQDRLQMVGHLIDSGSVAEAKRLTELAFGKADTDDQSQLFLTVLRSLPKDNSSWLEDFAKKVFTAAKSWKSQDCLEVIAQLIESGWLSGAKHLTELVISKSDSLEFEACLIEINTRLGVPTADSLRAFLKTIQLDRRSEVPAAFRRITNSGVRFSPQVVTLLKEEICRRYSEWRPDIEKKISDLVQTETSKAPVDNSRIGWQAGIITLLAVGPAMAILILLFSDADIDKVNPVPTLLLPTIVASIMVGMSVGFISRKKKRIELLATTLNQHAAGENQEWASVCSVRVAPRLQETSSIKAQILGLVAAVAVFMLLWFVILTNSPK